MSQARPVPRLERLALGRHTGIIVSLASLLLFAAAAGLDRSFGGAGDTHNLPTVWNYSGNTALIGGQWAIYGLAALARRLPGSGPLNLVILTVAMAAVASGLLARGLVKRGWPPAQAALGIGLNCLNPIVLHLAAGGQAAIFHALGIAAVIIAVDRLEALGDTQSLIILGLVMALLLSVWPNAFYFALPLAALLPLAFRDMRGYASATALFVIAFLPSLILVLALLLGATLFGLPATDVASVWSAPLHGLPPDLIARNPWLTRYGGQFWQPGLILATTCLLLSPGVVIVIARLLTSRVERLKPATALAALLLPPLSCAVMTLFWDLGSSWTAAANSIAALSAWLVTANLRRRERWLWIAASAAAVLIGWLTPDYAWPVNLIHAATGPMTPA